MRAVVAPFSGRGHAAGRAEHASTPGRAASPFAHVLASVQEPKERTPEADAERAGRHAGISSAEVNDEKSEAAEGSSSSVAVPVETAGAAPVHTPWLLLALGNGTYARTDEGAEESPDPSSMECVASGVAQAGAIVAAQTLVPVPNVTQAIADASAEPALATPDALASAMEVRAAVSPSGLAADVDAAATNAPQAHPRNAALEIDLPDANAPAPSTAGTSADEAVLSSAPVDAASAAAPAPTAHRSGDADDVPPAPEIAATDTSPANAVALALARWHAAARRSGGDVPARTTVSTATSEPAATPRTPGLAASRLAQALGGASGQQPSQADAQSQAAGAGLPSTRPPDALTGPSVGAPRLGHESAVSAVSLAQALAASAQGTSPLPVGPSAPSATPAPLAPAAGEQVLQQLVSSIKMQWKDGIGEAKLHLRPDALGAVSVALRVEGGAVTAVVRAESAQVQEWVLQHQQTLRQQMEAAGLQLDELVVSPDDQRQQSQDEASPEDQQRRARHPARGRSGEDEPRFELLA